MLRAEAVYKNQREKRQHSCGAEIERERKRERERALLFLILSAGPTMTLWKPHNSSTVQFTRISLQNRLKDIKVPAGQAGYKVGFFRDINVFIWQRQWSGVSSPCTAGVCVSSQRALLSVPSTHKEAAGALTALVHYLSLSLCMSLALALLCWGAVACFHCAVCSS